MCESFKIVSGRKKFECTSCGFRSRYESQLHHHFRLFSQKQEYYSIIKKIHNINNIISFKHDGGKLIFCLIEFRIMEEMKHVINSILNIYNPSEIGFAIVFGNRNKNFVYEITQNMKNVKYIHLDHNNINIRTYNKILKWKTFYEYFVDWEFVSIIQTDALICRHIDDVFFNYDYIGAPWGWNNILNKYRCFNGGFSLRRVSKMIEICNKNNFHSLNIISGASNEDIFWSNQHDMKYCTDKKIAESFSVELIYNSSPVGMHSVYKYMNIDNWKKIINYIIECHNIRE